jgi:hypothetical protein
LSATFFQTETSDVFQIDWFAGDSTIRELYVATVGGGPVVQVTTRVYPVQNNPAAPQAQAAVTRVLQTLRAGPAAEQPPPDDRPERFSLFAGAWARSGLGLTIDEQGTGRLAWRFYDDAAIVRQGEATIAFEGANGNVALGFLRAGTTPGLLERSVPVIATALPDGLLLLSQGNTTHVLCGADFLTAPDPLRSGLPCGYWR